MPPAVTILPSPAMISVPGPITMSTPGWTSGLPALPMPAIRPSRMPMSALTMPQWSRMTALVMTVSTAPSARRRLGLAHAVADHLAAAELDLLAVDRAVALDLDDELGVGEAHAVAGRRPEHRGVGARGDGICIVRHHRARAVDLRRSKPDDAAPAGIGDEPHLAALAGLEAHRGAGRDVEPHAARLLAVERERRDWSRRNGSASRPGSAGRRCWRRAAVDAGAAGVELDLAVRAMKYLAGDHGRTSADRLVDGDELGAVGEGRLDLDLVDHLGAHPP